MAIVRNLCISLIAPVVTYCLVTTYVLPAEKGAVVLVTGIVVVVALLVTAGLANTFIQDDRRRGV